VREERGKGGESREKEGNEGKGRRVEEEDFRAFPQFQICHYVIGCWERIIGFQPPRKCLYASKTNWREANVNL